MSRSGREQPRYSVEHVPLWIESVRAEYDKDSKEYQRLEEFENALDDYFTVTGNKPWARVNPAEDRKHPSEFSMTDIMRLLDEAKVENKRSEYEFRTRDEEETAAEEMLEEDEITGEVQTVSDDARHHLQRAQNVFADYLHEKETESEAGRVRH